MEFTLTGPLAEPTVAWQLVGDTDHLNRVGGNPPMVMDLQPDEHGFAALRGTMLGPAGIRHEFEEVDHRWVQERYFRQRRVIQGPLLRETLYEARLEPASEGVRPSIRLVVEPSVGVLEPVLATVLGGLRRQWQRRLDALPAPGARVVPEVLRRLDHSVAAALNRWAERGAPDLMVSRVSHLFETARAWELMELRPYQLAARWGEPREAVLTWFIEGTAVGVFEMYWSVRCPRCRSGVARADGLVGLADHAGCPSCRIDFDVDLGASVEVLFAAPPSLAPRPDEMFCTLYPARRPDVAAMALVGPGDEVVLDLDLAPGRWRVVAGGDIADQELEVGATGPRGLRWDPQDESELQVLQAGRSELRLTNPTNRRLRVNVARSQWTLPAVTAAEMATQPAYRGVFGPQSLAPDVRVKVAAVAVLFTDLTDSTAFYVAQGDAAAYGYVREHFRVLEQVVTRHGGVRVKTIGDAMMAAFHDPMGAVRAAVDMQVDYRRFAVGRELAHRPGLRIGVNLGPALGVHTDAAGLDYFGGTVNLAARAVAMAAGGEIVWTAEIHGLRELPVLVATHGLRVSDFLADLKGMPAPVRLWRVAAA